MIQAVRVTYRATGEVEYMPPEEAFASLSGHGSDEPASKTLRETGRVSTAGADYELIECDPFKTLGEIQRVNDELKSLVAASAA